MTAMRYVLSFAAQDFEAVAQVMVEAGSAPEDVPIDEFAAALRETYAPLFTAQLKDIKFQQMLPRIIRTATRFGISLPRDFVLILKQILYFDRYAKLAAPNLNVFSDLYLVDFMFTPEAQAAGIDMNQIMPLLMKLQQLAQTGDAATS